MTVISHERLTAFSIELLRAAGVPESTAELTATMLVAANLRGIDSHGVQLLFYYLKQIEAGATDPVREGRVVSENGACLAYDGERGLGQIIAVRCSDHAIRLAGVHGISIVTAREANHFGGCFWWAQRIADAGMIGIVMCNASSLVAPWQGREPRFGTNPICMAVPGRETWLLDMATTTVAANKIFKAAINGQETIPDGWALDAEGRPTTSTKAALEGGSVMPLGGYKGFGLAMMVEILSAVLGGGAMSTELGGIRFPEKPLRVSHVFVAIDIARFMPVEEFNGRVAKLVAMMKSSAPATGYDEILVAGEPELRIERERRATGIPIPDGNWQTLVDAANRLGVAV